MIWRSSMKMGDLVKTKGDPWDTLGVVIELGFHYVVVRWVCGTIQDVGYRSLEVVSESR
tara:strand:+ start:1118 stop:1294 length:177 start_codon:yes stop_codon:yes gene_type:complete